MKEELKKLIEKAGTLKLLAVGGTCFFVRCYRRGDKGDT